MKEQVFKIIAHVMKVPVETINEKSSPKNVESWESIKHMHLILAIEEAFSITFTDEEIVELEDAKTIIEKVKSKKD